MIYPLSTEPNDVNTAMIRIADENNKDIDLMKDEINRMRQSQKEIEERYKTQIDRWERYRRAYEATINSFQIQANVTNLTDITNTFPWGKL